MNARLVNDRSDTPMLPASPSFSVWTNVRGCDGGSSCGDYTVHRVLNDGQLAFVVVDIAGRGVGCRLPAYYLATNLLGLLTLGSPLERAAKLADRDFRAEFRGNAPEFAAVFAGLIDPYQDRMEYVAAGHETAIVLRDRTAGEALAATSFAFGLFDDAKYVPAALRFSAGDTLVVVTDGVTDARNDSRVRFGTGGVLLSVSRSLQRGDDPARALIEDATRYEAYAADDRAVLAVTFTGRS